MNALEALKPFAFLASLNRVVPANIHNQTDLDSSRSMASLLTILLQTGRYDH